jgi:hypothetical protein
VNAGALALSAGEDALFFTGIGAELKAARGLSKLAVIASEKGAEMLAYRAIRGNTNAAVARTMIREAGEVAKAGIEGVTIASFTGESYGWKDFALDIVPFVGTIKGIYDTYNACAPVISGFVTAKY